MLKLSDLLKKSGETASVLPDLLSDSSILTRNILQGLHSTRFSGKGEAFWQFNDYRQGDNIESIDWRKSASSNKYLVREKENETSKMIYFYYDKSKSMSFKSSNALNSKNYLAILISLTLSRIFLRNRENVYLFNNKNIPIKCANDLKNLDKDFIRETQTNNLPNEMYFKKNSLVIILSDFFFSTSLIRELIYKLKEKNVSGYLIHILDPLEINFNIGANIQLNDMETYNSFLLGDSTFLEKKYKENLNKLFFNLKRISKDNNWNYMLYNTEEKLHKFLLKIIHNILISKDKIA